MKYLKQLVACTLACILALGVLTGCGESISKNVQAEFAKQNIVLELDASGCRFAQTMALRKASYPEMSSYELLQLEQELTDLYKFGYEGVTITIQAASMQEAVSTVVRQLGSKIHNYSMLGVGMAESEAGDTYWSILVFNSVRYEAPEKKVAA